MTKDPQHDDDGRRRDEGVAPATDDETLRVSDEEKGERERRAETTSNDALDAVVTAEKEEFKEGGYGWVVVLCVFLTNAHTWGLNSSYAVFLAYYINSGEFGGASAITFAFVGGLSFSIALLVSPLTTTLIRIFGTRWTFGSGVVIQAAALIGASFSTKIWHLLLSQGIAFGVGMGFAFNSTVGIVSQWFHRRRSFANSLSTAGSGFGGLIYSLATNAIIERFGLAWAFRILAILSFVVNGVCCLLMRDRNKAIGSVLTAFSWDLFKRLEFFLFMGWGFFSLFGYVIVIFSLPDYGTNVGFSASQGSIAAAMLNLSQGIGRPLIGLASDRWGRINVCGISTLVAGLSSLLIWILAGQHFAGLIVYSLFGAFAGSLWPTVAPVGAEIVGIKFLPSALSIFWLILVLPATFAQPIAQVIKKPGRDGYLGVQILTGLMYLLSFICIWLLRVWKLRELEKANLTSVEPEQVEQHGVDLQRSTTKASTKTSTGKLIIRGFLSLKHRV